MTLASSASAVTDALIGPIKLSPCKRPTDWIRMWGIPRAGPNTSFQANVRNDEEYLVEMGTSRLPERLQLTVRDTDRAGERITVTLPVGSPNQAISLFALDTHHRRIAVPMDGKAAWRDPQTGALTIRLLTPAPGAATTVEVDRGGAEPPGGEQ